MRDVPVEVRERTADLARQADQRIEDGASFAAAGAFLRDQDGIAELTVGEDAIRFRLDGGRPAWVLDVGDAATPTGSSAVAARAPSTDPRFGPERLLPAAPRPEPPARAVTPSSVVSVDVPDKSAIILAPLGWLAPKMRATEVADILGRTRGYDGRVSYLENTAIAGEPGGDEITTDTFADLAGYSVVYVKSLGGYLCDEGGEDCHATVATQAFLDPDFHLTEAEDRAYDIMIFAGVEWEAIGVSADFFRDAYRRGIPDAMIFFDAGGLSDRGLTGAVKGLRSEYYYWDKKHPNDTLGVIAPFVERLAVTGYAPGVVYEEMLPTLKVGEAVLEDVTPIEFGGLRIREIVTLRDSLGADLADGSGITVDGRLDDGEPDMLHLVVAVDGITAEESEQTPVALTVDGRDLGTKPVSDGVDFGDGSWGIAWDVEMDDVKDGQEIALEAVARLAEGGTSRHAANVVAGLPDLGQQWEGRAVNVADTFFPGVTMTTTADIIFVRDPDAEPDARRVKFFVGGGSMVWRIEGSSGSCEFSGGPFEVPLRVLDPSDYLQFDLTNASSGIITYYGSVKVVEGPEIEVRKTCDGRNEDYMTRVEGTVWLAPQDEEFALSGTVAADTWERGSVVNSSYTWEFRRTQ